jgi:hypothetical protein
MKHLIMAIASLNAEIKKIEHYVVNNLYGISVEDLHRMQGEIKGLELAREILTEQLREGQPDVVRELTQIRAIINKM